jgi:Transposase DDE domain
MHNIATNFKKIYGICKALFKDEINEKNNLQFYPKEPKMNDLEIISLSCCMEALEIDSENLLWSKLKTDYTKLFPGLIDRSRFNRRRRRLSVSINKVQELISPNLENLSQAIVVDSIPIPVIKLAREKTFKCFKEDFETAPAKGYSAVNKSWFIGYKLHIIIFDNGVVQQSGITKGNVHDINFLKEIENLPANKILLGDRAYISKTVQEDLFSSFEVKLKVPFRNNQHDYKKHPKRFKSKRQMVETVFSQLCDQFNLKKNYAKTFEGLVTRLNSKLSSMAILQWINHLNGKKLAQIKHALSF